MNTLLVSNSSESPFEEVNSGIPSAKTNCENEGNESVSEERDSLNAEDDKNLHIAVFTTATLPWMTGTAVNPLFRAAFLGKVGKWKVTLVVPWLSRSHQILVYPNQITFESPAEQENYILKWLEERVGFKLNFTLIFYPAKLYAGKFCVKSMRAKMSKAWMSFLRLPLTTEVYKKILVILDKSVIPWLTNPLLLSDFLTRSYDIGGVISVMALSSLFVLMTQHGLEYPEFYNKLYALLEPSIFMAKYRSRFFELLDACLKSPLLPAYLASAFAKKLSRLALSSPPSGSLVVIALIHNLLRRHPSINILVHKVKLDDATINDTTEQIEEHCMPAKAGVDPFVSEEKNMAKCKALQSSLWEIETLRRHYCPAVSRFVASLETDLTVRAKTTEVNVNDFSPGSYGTIFADEVGRRIKQVPFAFYKTVPSTLFSNKISEKDGSIIDFPCWNFNQLT